MTADRRDHDPETDGMPSADAEPSKASNPGQSYEYDDEGQWVGTCEECGTNHGGYDPDTVGGKLACIRARADAIGGPEADLINASLDNFDEWFRAQQEQFIRHYFETGEL